MNSPETDFLDIKFLTAVEPTIHQTDDSKNDIFIHKGGDNSKNSVPVQHIKEDEEDLQLTISKGKNQKNHFFDASAPGTINEEKNKIPDIIVLGDSKYVVSQKVGKGNFGKVYKCTCTNNEREFVVKHLKNISDCKSEAIILKEVFDFEKRVTTEMFACDQGYIVMENMAKSGYFTLKSLMEMSDKEFSELNSYPFRYQMIQPIINGLIIALNSLNIEKGYSHLDLNKGNVYVNPFTLKTCESTLISGFCGAGYKDKDGNDAKIRNPIVLGDFGCAKKTNTQIQFWNTNGHENYKSIQRYYDRNYPKNLSIMGNNEDIYSLGALSYEMLLAFAHPSGTSFLKQNALFLLKFHGIKRMKTDNTTTTVQVAFSDREFPSFSDLIFESKFNSIITQIKQFTQHYKKRPNAKDLLSLINNQNPSNKLPEEGNVDFDFDVDVDVDVDDDEYEENNDVRDGGYGSYYSD
ncbi:hypothetical protein RB653_006338 [Dictyostelium firmibasis]|uniref:Protein kinase domain-containing protein n=1 Tax=Dictyostelium firmibasis TaxID=79012 RepID=A0AAN7Z1Y3_9MYCE